jgi:spoIIIJ-associated protein
VAVETSGRTVDEAVEHALKELGAGREDVDIEVLQEPRQALLGFGGREARVRVTRKPDHLETAREFAVSALRLMGFDVDARASETPESVVIDLVGQDLGGLIGRHGRTLDALELLVALYAQRRSGQRVQVIVDAAGYRARHERTLVEVAQHAAEKAVQGGVPIRMDPMGPRDRRIVHVALKDDARVRTASEGEDDERRVVVFPHEHDQGGSLMELPAEE